MPHHTKAKVIIPLDDFLRAIGENIGAIGQALETLQMLKDTWPKHERIAREIKDKVSRIIGAIQKSNAFLGKADPLRRVDAERRKAFLEKNQGKQTWLFQEKRRPL